MCGKAYFKGLRLLSQITLLIFNTYIFIYVVMVLSI